jgi:uncharacterized protein (DUF1697 family)
VTTLVAFLRAFSVGGKNRVPMAPLRDALTSAGLEEVATVLQSGNVVLRSRASAARTAKVVATTIEATFGLEIGVVVRSASQLVAVATSNPFLDEDPDQAPKSLYVAFLSAKPCAAAAAKLDPNRSRPRFPHRPGERGVPPATRVGRAARGSRSTTSRRRSP